MQRQYSCKDFFRQVPNALLARYFATHGLLAQLDFAALPEGKPQALFDAWLELTDAQRQAAEADFREVHALSSPKGFQAIIDEADWQMASRPAERAAFVEKLAALADHHARAMVTFLEHPECWKGATRFDRADNFTAASWRKRKNLPKVVAAVDAASSARLGELIGQYFRQAEGRGRHCEVEVYRRGDRDYFFAFPEDHAQRSIEYVEGEFNPRPHNPAFEIVFVYRQAEGELDIHYRGGRKVVAVLQGIFLQTILKLEDLPPDPADDRVYDLAPLAKRGFQFTHPPGSGIGSVVVKKLRFESRVRQGDKLTVEADGHRNPMAVYELVEQMGRSVHLALYDVTQVVLAATVFVGDGKPAKTVSIRITRPNLCTLKYDETDLALRQMLEASGIEPKTAPQAASGAAAGEVAPAGAE